MHARHNKRQSKEKKKKMVIETICDGNWVLLRNGSICVHDRWIDCSAEKIIHSFEDGKRVLSSIPEAAKESWMKGWLIGSGRPFTSGIVESKQTGQIEREKEKRTMERRAADRSNDICTRKTFKEIRYWVTLQGMRIFPGISSRSYLFSFEIRHNLKRHSTPCFLAICYTQYPKPCDKEKVHSTLDEHSSEFVEETSLRIIDCNLHLFFFFLRVLIVFWPW